MIAKSTQNISNVTQSFLVSSVSDISEFAHAQVDNLANQILTATIDLLCAGMSQLDIMRKIMIAPEVFHIQQDAIDAVGQSANHARLSVEEFIQTQVRLNNLVGKRLEQYWQQ